jgi:hypothetical protein
LRNLALDCPNLQLATTDIAPFGLAVDPYNGYVFVADQTGGYIQVIDPVKLNVVAKLTPSVSSSGPTGVAFDPFNNALYVTANFRPDLFVFNATGNTVGNYKELYAVKLPNSAWGVAVDCSTGNVWVSVIGSNQVLVMNPCTTVPADDFAHNAPALAVYGGFTAPEYFTFDPIHHSMYITNDGAAVVSTIPADSVGPNTGATAQDCSDGIADYGTAPGQLPYATTQFISKTTFTKLTVGAATNAGANDALYGKIIAVQLNTVDAGISQGTTANGVYWTQDVAKFKQLGGGSFGFAMSDDIFNFGCKPSTTCDVPTGTDWFPDQPAKCDYVDYSGASAYTCKQGLTNANLNNYIATVTLPFTIELNMTSYSPSSGLYKGDSTVIFSFILTSASLPGGKLSEIYDIVSFNSKAANSPSFHVGGSDA